MTRQVKTVAEFMLLDCAVESPFRLDGSIARAARISERAALAVLSDLVSRGLLEISDGTFAPTSVGRQVHREESI